MARPHSYQSHRFRPLAVRIITAREFIDSLAGA
jgi:hypothetical protein